MKAMAIIATIISLANAFECEMFMDGCVVHMNTVLSEEASADKALQWCEERDGLYIYESDKCVLNMKKDTK